MIPINKLTEEERRQYDILMDMVACEYGKSMPSKVKISACLDDPDEEDRKLKQDKKFETLGLYDRTTDTVFIVRHLLSMPLYKALGVVDHEFEHRSFGHNDRSRDFENDLTDRIGHLLELQYH